MGKLNKGWKSNPNYKPKYSLSIKYLKRIMTKAELKDLIARYMKAKGDEYGFGGK